MMKLLYVLEICLVLLAIPFVIGDAASSFSASVQVALVDFNSPSVLQLSPVFADGNPVNISINVSYNGTGVITLTITKPANYSNGFDWYVNESGVIKNVTDSGINIAWEMNFSEPNPVLYFKAPAPAITIDSIQALSTTYVKELRVGSDNPFANVTASTTVNTLYSSFALFQMVGGNESNVTLNYSFNVSGTTATWSGFSLSTKTFQIRGTKVDTPSAPSGGGGGGGGGGAIVLPPDDSKPIEIDEKFEDFAPKVEWIDVTLNKGDAREFKVVIDNKGETRRFEISTTSDFLEPVERSISIEKRKSKEITVRVKGLLGGEHQSRIVIEHGEQRQYVFFNIVVLEPASEEEPTDILKPASISLPVEFEEPLPRIDLLLLSMLVLLLAYALLHAYANYEQKKSKPRKPKTKARKRRKSSK